MKKIKSYFPHLLLILAFIIVLLMISHNDDVQREKEQQVEETETEIVTYEAPAPKAETVTVSETDMYIDKLTPVVMQAAGCISYRSKYLVACVLRNRIHEYGIDSNLFWDYIETPYKLTYTEEWELKMRLTQIEDSREAVKQAFSEPLKNADILYYRVPEDSERSTDSFFNQLEIVEEVDRIVFYKEVTE